jgi:hypothetical protein
MIDEEWWLYSTVPRSIFRLVVFVAMIIGLIVGVASFFIGRAIAEEMSPPLTIEVARQVFEARAHPGTIFAVGANRYLIKRLSSKSRREGLFQVEIEIKPMPKVQ